MHISSLPPEIITTIFKELEDERLWFSLKKSWAMCCLLSKSFLPPARSLLYHKVYSRYRHEVLGTIARQPHLAILVKDLTIEADGRAKMLTEHAIVGALAACNDLSRLTLILPPPRSYPRSLSPSPATAMPSDIQASIADMGPRLEALGLYGSGTWKPTSPDWLTTLTHLKSLSLDVCYLPPSTSRPSFALESFRGSGFGSSVASNLLCIEEALLSSRPTLTTLELTELPRPPPSLNLAIYPRLRTVRIGCAFSGELEADAFGLLGLAKSLLDIEEFSLSPSSSPRLTPSLETLDFFRLLPPTLQRLSLPLVPISTTFLLKTLSDTGSLPALKLLSLDYHVRSDGDDDEDDDGFALRPRQELEAISDAASRRGCKIEWIDLEEDEPYYNQLPEQSGSSEEHDYEDNYFDNGEDSGVFD
ncbi:hypothetical protein BCR35DRAFT_334073 [Leucosporidium creatinivorum]|uniref:F-box domain-containing protein n=1 Tax=Leucosporidium creatinivorum TaxID=106004 RepID=A0A1Y2ELQ2_9BASI|nr:hypothetical protein BCR35DRAFT_334073 [Leucosporidium creatinivorum]